MRNARYQWQLPQETVLTEEFLELTRQHNVTPLVSQLLWNRGIQSEAALTKFLQPQLTDLYDPFLFFDMEKVVERIHEAVMNGERILVYGDYDADGITSTTIMKEALELLGADVEFYLPNRFKDGYGPNLSVYEEKINAGIQLIITVDNGVSGHEAIDYANSRGVDVLVTDHHELPETLPNAYGIIHPRHPKGNYPFGDLAGVGVAFKVVTALLEEVPTEFLDLVAIGTIADMVSLTDENRVLVKLGLEAMKQTERLGLRELFNKSGSKIADVSATSIGFAISPRLNAVGRLYDPNPAVTLMSTFDETEAGELAQKLDDINNERKTLVEEITEEAMKLVDPQNEVHLIAQEGWHEGVLGIVAGRILKATGKPAIILTIKEDGIAKGSGRSVEQLNMFKMLDSMRELFVSFGGHHAAVGLSLNKEDLVKLQTQINQYVKAAGIDLSQGQPLVIDEVLKVAEASVGFINELNILAPFGTGNPMPHFLFKEAIANNLKQIGADNKHLKFSISDEKGGNLDIIGFDFGPQILEFQEDRLAVVGQLDINEWNGVKKAQLMLQDYAVDGLQIFDYRAKKNRNNFAFNEETLFIAFDKKVNRELAQMIQQPIHHFTDLSHLELQAGNQKYQQVVFVDCPQEAPVLKEIVNLLQVARIYLICSANDDAYLDGLGTREQYAKLFKFVRQQKQVDVRYKLPEVAKFLRIPEKLLIFMIQVFFDLEFVTIDDGVLKQKEDAAKRELSESNVYQQRSRKIKSEEFLLLSDLATLKNWLRM